MLVARRQTLQACGWMWYIVSFWKNANTLLNNHWIELFLSKDDPCLQFPTRKTQAIIHPLAWNQTKTNWTHHHFTRSFLVWVWTGVLVNTISISCFFVCVQLKQITFVMLKYPWTIFMHIWHTKSIPGDYHTWGKFSENSNMPNLIFTKSIRFSDSKQHHNAHKFPNPKMDLDMNTHHFRT